MGIAIGATPWTSLLRIMAAVWLTLLAGPFAIAQHKIDWKIVNQFPLLKDAKYLDELAQVGEDYRKNPANRNPTVSIPPTRWDYYYQRYDHDLVQSPIVVQLSLTPPVPNGICTWSVDGRPIASKDCGDDVQQTFPWSQREARVTAHVEQAGRSASYEQTIELRSILIVSLGDSYASGEGVPDVDAVDPFMSGLFNQDGAPLPRPAIWWDQRCHRSLNAGPAQAAMMLARENPRVQVLFMSFACSGAEVSAGLLRPYAGRETYGQLAKLLRTYLPNVPARALNRPGRSSASLVTDERGENVPRICETQPAAKEWECQKVVVKEFDDNQCKKRGGCPEPCLMTEEVLDCQRISSRGLDVNSDIDACDAICVSAATGIHHSHNAYVGYLPSQLNALVDALCKEASPEEQPTSPTAIGIRKCKEFQRPIDALLLSIGGNDIGFGSILRYSLFHGNSFDLAGFRMDRRNELYRLEEKYKELADALKDYVQKAQSREPLRVFLTQYPDPTYSSRYQGFHDETVDDRCGVRDMVALFQERTIVSHTADLAFFVGVSVNEVGELREHVIEPLQRSVRAAVFKYGWKIVAGHEDASKRHGYCNRWEDPLRRPWFHTHGDAQVRQGDIGTAFDYQGGFSTGVMHPNILGQQGMAEAIAEELSYELGLSRQRKWE